MGKAPARLIASPYRSSEPSSSWTYLLTTAGATAREVHAAMEDLVRAREAVRVLDRDGIIIRRGSNASAFCARGRSVTVKMRNANR
jgi:hypothetical protein